jgi:apolipoprotein D and lipocalin family protein
MHRLKRLSALAAVASLAACSAPGPTGGSFRAAGTPIYSNAVFLPERLAGSWVQVADFADPDAPACAAGAAKVTAGSPDRLALAADLCLGGSRRGFDGEARVTGPGRLTLLGADPQGIGAEWWVLWVDDGYRTLVVGTPSGRFGMILNRDADLPADRLRAAREILDWNGYDLTRLRPVGPA